MKKKYPLYNWQKDTTNSKIKNISSGRIEVMLQICSSLAVFEYSVITLSLYDENDIWRFALYSELGLNHSVCVWKFICFPFNFRRTSQHFVCNSFSAYSFYIIGVLISYQTSRCISFHSFSRKSILILPYSTSIN